MIFEDRAKLGLVFYWLQGRGVSIICTAHGAQMGKGKAGMESK
jgi:hypothetical protein